MTVLTAALLAADASKKASGIGLVIILALAAACVFLFKSMNKQIKRVPRSFDDEAERLPEPADPAADALAAARGEVPLARDVYRPEGELPVNGEARSSTTDAGDQPPADR